MAPPLDNVELVLDCHSTNAQTTAQWRKSIRLQQLAELRQNFVGLSSKFPLTAHTTTHQHWS